MILGSELQDVARDALVGQQLYGAVFDQSALGWWANSASVCRSNTMNEMASRCNRWATTSPRGPSPQP